jgi:hypothetical protein
VTSAKADICYVKDRKLNMSQEKSKKRTLISFSLAVATALITLYIQDYTSAVDSKQASETNATSHPASSFIESIN